MLTWEQAVQQLRQQPDQTELVRACYYDDPLLEAAERFAASPEWAAVLELLPRGPGHALDLGAGRGISSYALAGAGWRVVALEPDPSNLVGAGAIRALARESGVEIEVAGDYSEHLPFADASFDLVHCRQALHHARDLRQTCREIARVLKPGGTMVATREHVLSRSGDLPRFLQAHPLHHLYGGENAFLLAEYRGAMASAGLELRRALGPLSSPINFHPMSRDQWAAHCARPLALLVGTTLARRLLNPERPWGRRLLPLMAGALDLRDRSPGRLYSFVAHKDAPSDARP